MRKAEQKALSTTLRRFCEHSRRLPCTSKAKLKDKKLEQLKIIPGLSTYLKIVCNLKNGFLEFMHSLTELIDSEATAHTLRLFHAENSYIHEFKSCITAVRNWYGCILNRFDVPYANGFTKVCNTKTKVLKRGCFGVRSFSTFRNRILYCTS